MKPVPKAFPLMVFALTMLCCVPLGCGRGSPQVSAPVQETEGLIQTIEAFPAADPATVGMEDDALGRLSESLEDAIDRGEIVGAELLVIKDRHTVLHRAYGWNDRENELPMEIDTIFNIRSMTKPLTGAAAQLLIDQGRLALSDPVSKYLEGFDHGDAADITVEQLLTHRSGLPLSILAGTDDFPDLRTMATAVGQSPLEYTPGNRFYYSDAGSDVLGAVVEAVSGQRLDVFVTSNLLEPLGMDDSFYYTPVTASDPRSERIAALYFSQAGGYTKFWVPDEPFYPYAWGSQTLYSTPMDYARFLAMWMDGGTWNGTRILSEDAVQRTLDPVSSMTVMGGGMASPTGFLGLEMRYGQMAVLYVDQEGETCVIGHSGSDGTLAWGWPEQELMILVFTQSRGSTFWLSFESMIDQLLFHPGIAEMNRLAAETYAVYLGSYVDAAEASPREQTEVIVFNGDLAVKVPQGLIFALELVTAPLQWRFKLLPAERITFTQATDGDAMDGFLYSSLGSSTRLVRGTVRPPVDLVREDVSHVLGTYLDVEAGREIEVIFVNGTLAVRIPEAAVPLELLPPDEEGWWTMAASPAVSLRFDLDSEGNVCSFTARSPEGEAVRPRQVPGP